MASFRLCSSLQQTTACRVALAGGEVYHVLSILAHPHAKLCDGLQHRYGGSVFCWYLVSVWWSRLSTITAEGHTSAGPTQAAHVSFGLVRIINQRVCGASSVLLGHLMGCMQEMLAIAAPLLYCMDYLNLCRAVMHSCNESLLAHKCLRGMVVLRLLYQTSVRGT